MQADLKDIPSEYFNIKHVPGKGLCGLMRYIFTVGLVYGIDKYDVEGRYCYSGMADAKEALGNWDGTGDPGGPWIKHKGLKGEYSNQNIKQE